jgi:hypothetical protein
LQHENGVGDRDVLEEVGSLHGPTTAVLDVAAAAKL